MKIFEFNSYKDFLNSKIKNLPNQGRGANLKISKSLNIHPSLLSQILKGSKDFTLEQALQVSDFFGLSQLESQYLLCLVQIERAGTTSLKKFFEKQQNELLQKSENLSHRLKKDHHLNEQTKAIFYSNWHYSAIRLATSIPKLQTPFAIAKHLQLPIKIVNETLDFLVSHELCIEKNGHYEMGPKTTHLESDSPFIDRHRINWRLKSIEQFNKTSKEELIFTAPLSINKKDIPKIRSLLIELIDKVRAAVDDTSPDTIACLNIDWIELFKEDELTT